MEIKTPSKQMMEDFRLMKPEDFVSEYAHMAICDAQGKVKLAGKHYKGNDHTISHEDAVRYKFREHYLNDPWTGTIEERLLEGYLYCITADDLSLSPKELMAMRQMGFRKEVFVQTGRTGILKFVESGKRMGDSEATIAKKIWLQMRIDGVELYVNIKVLKVEDAEKKDEPEKDTAETQAGK